MSIVFFLLLLKAFGLSFVIENWLIPFKRKEKIVFVSSDCNDGNFTSKCFVPSKFEMRFKFPFFFFFDSHNWNLFRNKIVFINKFRYETNKKKRRIKTLSEVAYCCWLFNSIHIWLVVLFRVIWSESKRNRFQNTNIDCDKLKMVCGHEFGNNFSTSKYIGLRFLYIF